MKHFRWIILTPLVVPVFGLLTGCYEHVIRAEGPVARDMQIHEPAMKSERTVVDDLEDAVMGPKR